MNGVDTKRRLQIHNMDEPTLETGDPVPIEGEKHLPRRRLSKIQPTGTGTMIPDDVDQPTMEALSNPIRQGAHAKEENS